MTGHMTGHMSGHMSGHVTTPDPMGRLGHLARAMRRRWVLLAAIAAAAAGATVGYLGGEKRFSADRESAYREIDTYTGVLTTARHNRDERPKLDARIQGAVDRTLGPSLEAVDSEVRRRLNRIGEQLGLSDFSVTTGASSAQGTPAKKEFRRPDERSLRDEPDFVTVQASVNASGPASRMYQLLFRINAEPWQKRIESIRLDPDATGDLVRASIRLQTIFLPGRAPKAELAPDPAALAAASRFAELFASNPFRVPPPPAPIPPVAAVAGSTPSAGAASTSPSTAAQPTAPESPFPYGEWQVTGVVDGPGGAEAWLRHVPTGSQLTLQPGMPIGDLIFRRVEYDFALFDGLGGSSRVQVGSNLTQRLAGAG